MRLIRCFFFSELLEKELDLQRHYANKFRFILIDEFQDTSTLQMDWLKLMINRDDQMQKIRNCFMAVVIRHVVDNSIIR